MSFSPLSSEPSQQALSGGAFQAQQGQPRVGGKDKGAGARWEGLIWPEEEYTLTSSSQIPYLPSCYSLSFVCEPKSTLVLFPHHKKHAQSSVSVFPDEGE